MYEIYEDRGEVTKVDLTFTEYQALRRVIEAAQWDSWSFDTTEDELYICDYNSLKNPLLVLTAECVVVVDMFAEAGNYVLSVALDNFVDKIKEIWSEQYE